MSRLLRDLRLVSGLPHNVFQRSGKGGVIYRKLLKLVSSVGSFWRQFERHQGRLWASALAFDTALSLAPLLALVFILSQAVGIKELLEPFILSQLTGDNVAVISGGLKKYLQRADLARLGFASTGMLLVTLFFLLENGRSAMNMIWQGKKVSRTVFGRCLDYLLILLVTPLLLALAIGLTSVFQSQWLVQWLIKSQLFGEWVMLFFRLTPVIWSSLVLVLLYLLLPDAKVKVSSALSGGLLTGCCWQLIHAVYFKFQFGLARHNLFYGKWAVIPFLLVWIYTSWLVLLLGFELVNFHQNRPLSRQEDNNR